jgi:hypothetical protein
LPLIDMRMDYSDGGSDVLWEDGERIFRRAGEWTMTACVAAC